MQEISYWRNDGWLAVKDMNAVFIHIPKTAGLMIQEVLKLDVLRYPHRAKKFKNKGLVTFGHLNYPKLVKRQIVRRDFDRTAFKFAFCRNPYDRAVSHYFYVQKKHPDILSKGMSFLDFTSTLKDYGHKFEPQSWWVKDVKLDFLGKFENLNSDLTEIAYRLGINLGKLPKINTTEHGPFQEYYCQESKENIAKYYQVDFERFGYDHNLLHR